MNDPTNGNTGKQKPIFVTLTGLPLSIQLDWPFHRSTSGADFWVLHGDIRLENTDGLHAPISVNMTLVVKDVLPSLERAAAEGPVINALRKEVDRQQIEFLKSGKLLPVAFSSRHYDFKRTRWVFEHADDAQLREFILRTVYWNELAGNSPVPIADPFNAQYLDVTREQMLGAAQALASEVLLNLNGEQASATDGLLRQSEKIKSDMRAALEALQKKHEFERG
jgi:hypothetical protein